MTRVQVGEERGGGERGELARMETVFMVSPTCWRMTRMTRQKEDLSPVAVWIFLL